MSGLLLKIFLTKVIIEEYLLNALVEKNQKEIEGMLLFEKVNLVDIEIIIELIIQIGNDELMIYEIALENQKNIKIGEQNVFKEIDIFVR